MPHSPAFIRAKKPGPRRGRGPSGATPAKAGISPTPHLVKSRVNVEKILGEIVDRAAKARGVTLSADQRSLAVLYAAAMAYGRTQNDRLWIGAGTAFFTSGSLDLRSEGVQRACKSLLEREEFVPQFAVPYDHDSVDSTELIGHGAIGRSKVSLPFEKLFGVAAAKAIVKYLNPLMQQRTVHMRPAFIAEGEEPFVWNAFAERLKRRR